MTARKNDIKELCQKCDQRYCIGCCDTMCCDMSVRVQGNQCTYFFALVQNTNSSFTLPRKQLVRVVLKLAHAKNAMKLLATNAYQVSRI
jgi:hypothetical protein